ncbi:MAG: hypothetical protein ACJ79B_07045 [Gemmatimonadaceae bacterium]
MRESDDEGLHARFDALREYDARSEPEFHALWRRAESRAAVRSGSGARAMRWWAAAAAVCAIVGATFLLQRARVRRNTVGITTEAQWITQWQSPTAGLLRVPGGELLDPPPLFSSVFDGVTAETLKSRMD